MLLSLTVAWFTFRRGSIGMTRPSLIAFLSEEGQPKIFMRALLYASGKRGHIVESLYLKVRRGHVSQVFDFWMYGESRAEFVGSGLRVGEEGVASNHYFLPPKQPSFEFLAGQYVIEVHPKISNAAETACAYQSRPFSVGRVRCGVRRSGYGCAFHMDA
jgi:hypothetical protein